MNDDLHLALVEVRRRLLDPGRLTLAKAGGQQRGATAPWTRAELRPIELRGRNHLQITTFDLTQAFTSNYAWGPAAEKAVDELLATPFAHWHVASTDHEFAFRVTKSGKVLVTEKVAQHVQRTSHDREKKRFVPLDAPFLSAIGICTPEGELKPSRTAKYRQVEEFVRLLDAAMREALASGRLGQGPIRVVDLGCGNAYLTFAAFHHLTNSIGLDVEMIGVDSKVQARDRNERIAKELGWRERLWFVDADIRSVELPEPVDVVLALHACDTATDESLARGVRWDAALILAAPCCHHDLQRQLKNAQPPKPYGAVTRDGMLRERWADVLTDALRASLLRQSGYRTDVVEFVDSKHTPRNVLLRAHRTGRAVDPTEIGDYNSLVDQWQVTPRLSTLLGGARERNS